MIDEIYARCPEMFAAASDRADEDWFAAKAHTHERHKFTLLPSIEVLARFRDYQIGGIGIEKSDSLYLGEPLPLFTKYPEPYLTKKDIKANLDHQLNLSKKIINILKCIFEPDGYTNQFQKMFMNNLVEFPDCGGFFIKTKILKNSILTSLFAIRTAHRAAVAAELYTRENDAPPHTILELGGGFGKSLADLIRIFPAATAYYVDLPVNMAVAAHYFDGRFPGRVNLVWLDTDAVRAGMINVVAPWLIDKIDLPIDLMINFLSMHHMPQQTMDFYFARLIAPKVRFLYHENRLVPWRIHEGEGFLEKTPKRSEMDIRHSIQIPWGTSGKATFSEFIANPAST